MSQLIGMQLDTTAFAFLQSLYEIRHGDAKEIIVKVFAARIQPQSAPYEWSDHRKPARHHFLTFQSTNKLIIFSMADDLQGCPLHLGEL